MSSIPLKLLQTLGGLVVAAPVLASCLGSGDDQIESLAKAIGRQPLQALAKMERLIEQREGLSIEHRAWLEASRAQAQRMLGIERTALPAAIEAASTLPKTHPARLHLDVARIYGEPAKPQTFEVISSMRQQIAAQPIELTSTLCLKLRLASVMADYDRLNGESFQLASDVYASAKSNGHKWISAEAASVLGQVVNRTDSAYGQQLSDEALSYFRSESMNDMVANELWMKAFALTWQLDEQSLVTAEGLFRSSAEAAKQSGNAYAESYALAGICEVLARLGKAPEALHECSKSLPPLRKSKNLLLYSTTIHYASAMLKSNRPWEAAKLLKELSTDFPESDNGYYGYLYYETRGRTMIALDKPESAAADLGKAISLLREYESNNRSRSNRLIQARFQVDNLTQQLDLQAHEARAEKRQKTIVLTSGFAVMTLMAIIFFVLIDHRRRYRQLAFTDQLTGVSNRRYTEARAKEALLHAKSRQLPISIALLDLDHFKACNDRYGHDGGDQALQRFAEVAKESLRPGDIIGRWGGEEFLLILPGAARAGAECALERLRNSVSAVKLSLAPEYPLRFSAGVVTLNTTFPEFEAVLTRADSELYRAKADGRARSSFAGL